MGNFGSSIPAEEDLVSRAPIEDNRTQWTEAEFQAYLDESHDEFEGMKLIDALHLMLSNAKLPNTAQVIDRILEKFSRIYYERNQDLCHAEGVQLVNEDSVYVLCFGILMLNTDSHKPEIKTKMTFEQFSRNMKGANNAGDFPQELLQEIYDTVQRYPIAIAKRDLEKQGASIMTKSASKAEETEH